MNGNSLHSLVVVIFVLMLLQPLQVFSQTADQHLPEVLAESGFTRTEPAKQFAADDLWQHINGAAEQYIQFGCESLTVAYYRGSAPEEELTVELYRMKDAVHGFGIYSVQRPREGVFLAIGSQGYAEEGMLTFFRDRWYVRLQLFPIKDSAKKLEAAARAINGTMREPAGLPAILKRFPATELIADSFGFIADGILGFGGIEGGYQARYSKAGQEIEIIYIPDLTVEKRSEYIKKVREGALARGAVSPPASWPSDDGGGFSYKDTWRGSVVVTPVGTSLLIVSGTDEKEWIQQFISAFTK